MKQERFFGASQKPLSSRYRTPKTPASTGEIPGEIIAELNPMMIRNVLAFRTSKSKRITWRVPSGVSRKKAPSSKLNPRSFSRYGAQTDLVN
ncbi:hypothetical protein D9M72_598680 [compost metagenome]